MKKLKADVTFETSLNVEHIANADGQIREILEEIEPTKDTSKKSTFGEQMHNLEEGLSQHGSYDLNELYVIRKLYIKTRAKNENAGVRAIIHYGNVFGAVVNKALYRKAKTLTVEQAEEFDAQLTDQNHEHGIFFSPQTKQGEEWLPCSMVELATVEDRSANTWDMGNEPYAGTSFLETI